jgi:hypothetical protein
LELFIYFHIQKRQKYEKEPYIGGHNIADGAPGRGLGGHVPPVYMLKEALFISANNMLLALMK